MKKFLSLAIAWIPVAPLLLGPGPAASADIKEVQLTMPRTGSGPARVEVFEFDPARAQIDIFTSRSIRGEHEGGNSGLSVRKASEYPGITRKVTHRALLVNGGFSGSKTDRPVGLLISNGAVASAPSLETRPAERGATCPFRAVERYRLSGVFCVRPDRSVKIGKIDDTNLDQCREAIQAGPLLVEKPGQVGICESSEDTQPAVARTAICVTHHRVKIVLALDPVTLFDLANWLADAKAGLGCSSALNLSGDTSTGAVFYRGGMRSFADAERFGEGKFPQASFLLIHDK